MTGLRPGRARASALHHPARPATRRYPQTSLDALRCPHCGGGFTVGDGQFTCTTGHTFDVAKHGYVALLAARARTDTGDTADMVAARVNFLGAGHYAPIAAAVAGAIGAASGVVLEIGAGTGYYLQSALHAAEPETSGIAIDSSKFAARRAAAAPQMISVVADAWSALPIFDRAVGAVVSVFAPRTPAEIARVLRPGGRFLAVTPEPRHLLQLRQPLGMLTVDDGKADRLAESLAGLLRPDGRQLVEFELTLPHADISALVRMGPTARHLAGAEVQARIEALPEPFTTAGAVTLSSFQS